MSMTRIDIHTLETVLLDIRESIGETNKLIQLETVLRIAKREDNPMYLDADDCEFLEEWLD